MPVGQGQSKEATPYATSRVSGRRRYRRTPSSSAPTTPRAASAPRHEAGKVSPRRRPDRRDPNYSQRPSMSPQTITSQEHVRYLHSPKTKEIITQNKPPRLAEGYEFPEPEAVLEVVQGDGIHHPNTVVMRCRRTICHEQELGDGNIRLCGERMAVVDSKRLVRRGQLVEVPEVSPVLCGQPGVTSITFATPFEKPYAISAYDNANSQREADSHIN